MNIKELHSVEIIGGGSRIPVIQKVIQDVLDKQCSKTLHATECVARGAAIRSLMYHPLFKTGQFNIEESIYHPIGCQISHSNDDPQSKQEETKKDEEDLRCILFPKGCKIPAAKAIDLKRNDSKIEIDLFYDPEVQGYNSKLGKINIQTIKSEATTYSNKARIIVDENGLLAIDKVELLEEYKIEPLKPQKEQNPGLGTKIWNSLKFWNREQEDSLKGSVEIKSKDLKYESTIQFGLSNILISQYGKDEINMLSNDKSIIETNESRNALESYIYEIKAKIDDEFKNVIEEDNKAKLLQLLDSTNDWLYKSNTESTKKDFQNKKEEIKKLVAPYEKRLGEWTELQNLISEFKNSIDEKNLQEIVPVEKHDELRLEIESCKSWIAPYDKILQKESNLGSYIQEIKVKNDRFMNKILELSSIKQEDPVPNQDVNSNQEKKEAETSEKTTE